MADADLQAKRREWGRRYREKKRLEAQKEVVKASKGPTEIMVVDAKGVERKYRYEGN